MQAAIALGSGLVAAAAIRVTTGSNMWAAAVGFTLTAALAGTYLGRRDARALTVTEPRGLAGAVLIALAFVRALAKGSGAALAAIVIARSANPGFWYEWVLPLVPAVVGAVAHHLGMFYENLEKASKVKVKASQSELAKFAAEMKAAKEAKAAQAPTETAEVPQTLDPAMETAPYVAALPGEVDEPHSTTDSRQAVFSRRRPA
ncbi:hypothetical protein [Cryptosporangium sp. NPDC051539]|uniref:hypothetical protein n=1 Tax=Cryptosporangium sp. NPDC051539 TaxID=3363962 RepID=UPI003787FE77